MRIFNKANNWCKAGSISGSGSRPGNIESDQRNYLASWPPHIDTSSINQDQSSSAETSPVSTRTSGHGPGHHHAAPRLNSIAELLEHFREEDTSATDDTKHIQALPLHKSSLTSSISSSSLSAASEVSSVTSSKDSKESWKSCTKDHGSKSPVDHWLSELPSLCESECSVMLQSKSLQGNIIITLIMIPSHWSQPGPGHHCDRSWSLISRTTASRTVKLLN